MRYRKTYEDSVAEINSFTPAEKQACDMIKQARDDVRKSGTKATRAAVRAQAQCSMDVVVRFLGLLEAIENPPKALQAGEPPDEFLAPPPAIAQALADMRSVTDRIEAAVGTVVQTAVSQEHERTRKGLESQLAAAAHATAAMGERAADFEETAEELAATLREQHETISGLAEQLAQSRQEAETLHKRLATFEDANATLTSQLGVAIERAADLQRLNDTFIRELEFVRQDRESIKCQAALLAPVQAELTVARELCDARAREVDQLNATLLETRRQHDRELGRARHEYSERINEQRSRILELESGFMDAYRSKMTAVQSPAPE